MISLRHGARVLHVHRSFAQADPQARRCARLIDGLGGRLTHFVVSADGDFSAAETVSKGIKLQRETDFPALGGVPLPGRLQALARALQDYDLVLTYGRGGVGAALAHTLFSKVYALPPLIHHEDGSDETPRQRRGWRSKWLRRVGLGKASGLVVPNELVEHAALVEWQQPLGRVKTIADGADLKRFAKAAKPDALARLSKRTAEFWVGCFATDASAADMVVWVRAIERIGNEWHLVFVGADAPDTIMTEAARHGLDHRVHFVPGSTDHATALALFDVVAISRGREPVPSVAIEAMAAGRAVVTSDRTSIPQVLGEDNADLLAHDDPRAALERLAGDRYLRERIGIGNRELAEAERDLAAMIAAYRRLYTSAMGHDAI